jgi:hypothetical protein
VIDSGLAAGSIPVLLGQVDAGGPGLGPTLMVIGVVAIGTLGLVLVVGLPAVLGIRSENRKREMEHLERMRAIELGRPLPGDQGARGPAKMALAMGVAVPIGVFGIAWLAANDAGAASPFIWPSAAAMGVAAIICATVLASRAYASEPEPRPDPAAKPYVDPDAYDAVEHQHS